MKNFSTDYKLFLVINVGATSTVLVLGIVTRKQIEFFYWPLGWSLGNADQQQLLHGINC